MIRKSILLASFVSAVMLACAAFAASEAAEKKEPAPPHLVDAEAIVHGIKPENNTYAHKDGFIRWKGEGGEDHFENKTDCSEFLNLLLEHAYKITPEKLARWIGRHRPTATIWFDAIEEATHSEKESKIHPHELLERIESIKNARPGDIIVIKYPPGEGKEDTGHVMLIAGEPKHREATEPVEGKTHQWDVEVIDSSKSGHGRSDTRAKSDGAMGDGVGKGELRLYSDAEGKLDGYSWSTATKSAFVPVSKHPIAIARIRKEAIEASEK